MRGTLGLPASTLVEAILNKLDHFHSETIFIFLNGDDQEFRLTLGELDARARAIAARLQEQCSPGDRALLLYPSGIEFASAFFGCLYAGVIAVCAYPPRNNRNLGRLAAIIKDCQPAVVMASEEVQSKAEPMFQAESDLADIIWLTSEQATPEWASAWKAPILNPEQTCFLQYTSGSTGNPKGVMVSHQNLLHNTALMHESFGHTEQTVFVSWLPLFHDMGLIGNLLPAVILARPMVFMPPAAFLQRPARWLETISRFGGTVSMAPNFAYDLCVERIKPDQMEGLDLRTWELAINAAEPVRPDTMAQFSRKFAPVGFRAKTMSPGYGLAEATLTVTNNAKNTDPILRAVDGPAFAENRVITTQDDQPGSRLLASSGKGWFGQRLEIVKPETHEILGPDDIGEIWIQGPSVALGYWRNEAATRETFQATTKSGEGPFLRTGDLGFVGKEGELYITGRHKDVIIIHGRNHYPQDIEHTVTSCHPALAPGNSAAFAVDTEDREALVIFQEVKRTWLRKIDSQDVIAAIHSEVAREHDLQPHAVILLRPGRIPKTSSGKIQRRACRQMFESGDLEAVGSHFRAETSTEASFVDLDPNQILSLPVEERASLVETWLQGMVAEILNLELSLLDTQKPLATYGADSLAVTQIMARIKDTTGLKPSWEQMFTAPHLADLATWIVSEMQSGDLRPDPLPRQDDHLPVQLSFPQERMWLLDRMNMDGIAYNVPFAWQLDGHLSMSALNAALAFIKRRHEPLATAIVDEHGIPRAAIHEAEALPPLCVVDLTHLEAHAVDSELKALLERECRHRFDLSKPQAIRSFLYRLGTHKYVLLIHMHHIVCDGWSIGILRDELTTAYHAVVADRDIPLQPLRVRYRDYAAWQRTSWDATRHDKDLNWWSNHLKDVPALELPTDKPRPGVLSQNAGCTRFIISREQRHALKHLASDRKATLYMTLLAGFQVLLWRYSEQTDFAIGVPVANRNRTELEDLIGFFVNTIAPRADLSGRLDFVTLLDRVRHRSLGAFAHSELPFEVVVQSVGGKRDLSRAPIFQVMFTLQQAELDRPPRLKGMESQRYALPTAAAQFDLSLDLIESDGRLTGELVYHKDLFTAQTAETMIAVYKHILEQITETPEAPISALTLLPSDLRQTVLDSFGRGPQLLTQNTTVPGLFHRQAVATPNAEAVLFEGTSLSYAELTETVHQLSHHLRRQGAGCETRIAVFLDRCLELPAVLLAILSSGAAYVPIDPDYPAERIQTMLEDAAVSQIVTHSALATQLPEFSGALLCLDQLAQCDLDPSHTPTEIHPNQAAYMIFTSGSTGRPKGVVVEHGSFVNYTISTIRQLSLGPGDRILQFAALSFDVTVAEFFPVLACGGAVVLPQQPKHWSYADFTAFVSDHRITGFELPTHYWREWTDHLTRTGERLPLSLRFVMAGTERVAPESLNQWRRLGVPFIHVFGLTETTVTSLTYRMPLQGDKFIGSYNLPVGKPAHNTRVFLLNDALEPVAPSVPGMIYLGGAGLTRGYFGLPARTAERFIPNPFADVDGERLYDTGDRGQFSHDGLISFLGRRDHQIKIRGFRIEPGEIESLMVEHPMVAQALVVANTDQDEPRLLAYWIPVPGQTALDSKSLMRFLKDQLPAHMIPQSFIALDAFPVTSNGKIDLAALSAMATMSSGDLNADQLPTSDLEQTISRIWREVLGLEKVGIQDHFFEVGGSSSQLIRVHGLLCDHFPDLNMVSLFQHPTIASLADHLSTDGKQTLAEQTDTSNTADQEIAIVGLAARYPGSPDLKHFWDNLCKGLEAISHFDDETLENEGIDAATRNHPGYIKSKAVLEAGDCFDAEFFGYGPREAELMDPQHRVFLELAWTAMEHAGYAPRSVPGRVGVFAGASRNSYLLYNLAGRLDGINDAEAISLDIGNSGDFLTTRIAHKLNFKGPALNLQTACSTSLVAVVEGVQALLTGNCDMALAGGVTVGSPRREGYFYQDGGILSPDGHCRPFDQQAAGTVPGEGAGVVVLKRLEDAKRDGDAIYAVVRGAAINNDGAAKVGFTAPGVEGQARVIANAHDRAGIDPRDLGYIEAHGTGTALGDPVEITALKQAFARKTQDRGFCALGSVKGNLGHADAAAGIAGLIKCVLALHHAALPPTPHFQTANPNLDLENTPFYIPSGLQDWPTNGKKRLAAVSSFGIGGTNAHVVLEQAPAQKQDGASTTPQNAQVFVVSAHTETALTQLCEDISSALEHLNQDQMHAVVTTLQQGREALRYRRALVANSLSEAAAALRQQATGLQSQALACEKPALVFLFPGQGSQYPGMARKLYDEEPKFRAPFDQCATLLQTELGQDIRDLVFAENDAEALNQTRITQPVLFAMEYALACYWLDKGLKPDYLLGHSVGEYVAACLAGVFSLEDALHLVAVRGRLIQSLPAGAMLAVSAAPTAITPFLTKDLDIAAHNGPQHTVVAGSFEAIEGLQEQLKGAGIASTPLRTSHAFHSAMMDPILASFRAEVARISLNPPQQLVMTNVEAQPLSAEQACDPDYWVTHLRQQVRYADALAWIAEDHGTSHDLVFLEVGPGRSLTTLASKQFPASIRIQSLPDAKGEDLGRAGILAALLKLWTAGVPLDWSRISGTIQKRVALPTYPFERKRYWLDAQPMVMSPTSKSRITAKDANPKNWFYLPSWRRALPATPSDASLCWLVLGTASDFTDAVVAGLRERGQRLVVVQCGRELHFGDDVLVIDPTQANHFEQLLEYLNAQGMAPERVLHLWALNDATGADFETGQEQGLFALLHLIEAVNHLGFEPPQLIVPTHNLQHPQASGQHTQQATLLGLVRVLSQEMPRWRCRAIDLGGSLDASLADILVVEALSEASSPVVGWQSGSRWVEDYSQLAAPTKQILQNQGVYLITGGMGWIGLLLAEYLMETYAAKVALLSRSSLPAEDQWPAILEQAASDDRMAVRIETIMRWRARGFQAHLIRADVADAEALAAAIGDVERQLGPINGVFHAAGLTDDRYYRPLLEGGVGDCQQHFQPKIAGLHALEKALKGRKPDFCMLFSSVASVLGGLGYLGYAAANAYLDAWCLAKVAEGDSRWLSVAWDGWLLGADGSAATAGSPASFAMTNREGLEAVEMALNYLGSGQVVVSTGDLEARRAQWSAQAETATNPAQSQRHQRPNLAGDYVAPRDPLEEQLCELWQDLLGIDQVGIHDHFFDLGGDSLAAVQLAARLWEHFQMEVSSAEVLEWPSVAHMSEGLLARLSELEALEASI